MWWFWVWSFWAATSEWGLSLVFGLSFGYALWVRISRLAMALPVVTGLIVMPPLRRARAETWSDTEPEREPGVVHLASYNLELGAEYRAVGWYTNALDLAERKVSLLEHRLRLGASLGDDSSIRLVTSADLADGVVWGAGWVGPGPGRVTVRYRGSGDPGDPNSYGLAIVPGDWLVMRRLYGEVPTPLGVVRLGRQPAEEGHSILYPDGDGNPNRFGYPGHGVFADRLQFTSNLLGPFDNTAQATADRGLLFTSYVDRLATGDPVLLSQDLARAGARLHLVAPLPTVAEAFDAAIEATYGWQPRYATEVGLLRAALDLRAGGLGLGGEAVYVTGRTRELSASFGRVTAEPPTRQLIQQWGARAVARWDEPAWTAYLEFDYASADRDPSLHSRLTQFYFAPDTGVGLLLFPRVLAFETARSRAAATARLAGAGVPGTAAGRFDTHGGFTNATAFYPQFDLRPFDSWLLRGGVLMAWTPSGVVDPARSLAPGAGATRLNYRGGEPGRFYGVELDARIGWRPPGHCAFDLEGALLMPGDALADARGYADASALVQGRATLAF